MYLKHKDHYKFYSCEGFKTSLPILPIAVITLLTSQSPAVTLVSGPMQNSFVQSVVVTSCLQMKFEIKVKGSFTKYVGQVFGFF